MPGPVIAAIEDLHRADAGHEHRHCGCLSAAGLGMQTAGYQP